MITNLLSYFVLSTTTSLMFAGWSSALSDLYDGLLLLVLGLPMGFMDGHDETTACTL
jgi:hypothetical protein